MTNEDKKDSKDKKNNGTHLHVPRVDNSKGNFLNLNSNGNDLVFKGTSFPTPKFINFESTKINFDQDWKAPKIDLSAYHTDNENLNILQKASDYSYMGGGLDTLNPDHNLYLNTEQDYLKNLGGAAIAFPNFEEKISKEDVEALIENKINLNKGESLGKDGVLSILKEYEESKQKQGQERLTKTIEDGLVVISKRISAGGKERWCCKKCGNELDVFEGEGTLEKIRKYLVIFGKGGAKRCKNGHANWFEITNDGMVWSVRTVFDNEFRPPKA